MFNFLIIAEKREPQGDEFDIVVIGSAQTEEGAKKELASFEASELFGDVNLGYYKLQDYSHK